MKFIQGFKKLQFQIDTVNRALQCIKNTNGVFIMDSTGLGKTLTASLTAINAVEIPKILIICANNYKSGWVNTLKSSGVEFQTSTANKIPEDNDFNVIIVDEAHNYRNTKSQSYQNIWLKIRTQDVKPVVILLSATPFQNNFTEFKNTFNLIRFKTNTAASLVFPELFRGLEKCQKELDKINRYTGGDTEIKGTDALLKKSFKDIGDSVSYRNAVDKYVEFITNLLPEFCVRTTREDIKKLYPDDYELIGLFPKINYTDVKYTSNEKFDELVNRVENYISRQKITFCRYNLNGYAKTDSNYIGMSGIMRTYLLKRLDSSLYAFRETLENMISEYKTHIELVKNSEVLPDNNYDVIIDEKSYLVTPGYLFDLEKDLTLLNELLEYSNDVNQTEKEQILIDNILNSNKVVVFTEYVKTLERLQEILAKNNIPYLKIDGNSTDKELLEVQKEFDPNIDKKEQRDQYKVLICTDVMSEGTNLHRASKIIHYDSKWNPAKLTQRDGRVDRIYKDYNDAHSEIEILRFETGQIIDSIIYLEKKIEHKKYNGLKILNYDWRNYSPSKYSQFETFRKYYIEPAEKNHFIFKGFKTLEATHFLISDWRESFGNSFTITRPDEIYLTEKASEFYFNKPILNSKQIVDYDKPYSVYRLSNRYVSSPTHSFISTYGHNLTRTHLEYLYDYKHLEKPTYQPFILKNDYDMFCTMFDNLVRNVSIKFLKDNNIESNNIGVFRPDYLLKQEIPELFEEYYKIIYNPTFMRLFKNLTDNEIIEYIEIHSGINYQDDTPDDLVTN